MTEPEATKNGKPENTSSTGTTNTAHGTVGIQAETVHDSNVYIVNPGASPEEKFEKGVNYLDGGVPAKAHELIGDAMTDGLDNAKVRFHWAMAVLSKRSLNDLDANIKEQLRRLPEHHAGYGDDEWKDALAVVDLLVGQGKSADGASAFAALDELPRRQRDMIVRHLDLVLTGTLKDRLWLATRQAAEETRFNNGRIDRVWAYFQATPAQPRVWVPGDDETTPLADWLLAASSSVGFLAAVAALGRWAAAAAPGLATVALVFAIAAAVAAAVTGYGWHRRRVQRTARDRRYRADPRTHRVAEPGFRRRVDDRFRHYEARYPLPNAVDNDRMLAKTRGIRATLRDEIAEVYQIGFTTPEIDWLIRFHHLDVRDRWRAGTLCDDSERYLTGWSTRLWCVATLCVLAISLVAVVLLATRTALPGSALAGLVGLGASGLAIERWHRILGNRHRRAEAAEERARLQEVRRAEYDRWTHQLASVMPSEEEMEIWLEADKTMFLASALRTSRLMWREIVRDGWLQAPASSYRRGRTKGGQWRYSRYDLRLFLVTEDGVREIGTELNFLKGTRTGLERRNYRFDAVSSVQVTPSGESTNTLELVLTNGPARQIVVTDEAPDSVEDKESFAELNLDAAGFGHTLRILEGIAAEGKSWIGRDRERNVP